MFLDTYGRTLLGLGRHVDAEAVLLEAHGIFEAGLGALHERTLDTVTRLADLYDAWGKPEQAAEWRAKLPAEQDAVASDPTADEKQDE